MSSVITVLSWVAIGLTVTSLPPAIAVLSSGAILVLILVDNVTSNFGDEDEKD